MRTSRTRRCASAGTSVPGRSGLAAWASSGVAFEPVRLLWRRQQERLDGGAVADCPEEELRVLGRPRHVGESVLRQPGQYLFPRVPAVDRGREEVDRLVLVRAATQEPHGPPLGAERERRQ